jgi:hypothetical protein
VCDDALPVDERAPEAAAARSRAECRMLETGPAVATTGEELAMTQERSLFGRLRSRGEEVLTQISAELMSNPRFVKAVAGALRGKERVEDLVAKAVQKMNVPTRTEFRRAVRRIEALEEELRAVKAARRPSSRRAKAGSTARRRKAPRKGG